MSKLFKKKADDERRSQKFTFRVSEKEISEITAQAELRKLDPSEYLRRVALHRRAEVKVEMDMILELSKSVRALREMHAAYLQAGKSPPLELLQPLLDGCEKAIRNLSNY